MVEHKKRSAVLYWAMVGLCLFVMTLGQPCTASAWPGQVVKVHDGDTVTVRNAEGELYRVRIYGVDCPEMKQKWGEEAQDMTVSLLGGKTVQVIAVNRDKYKRHVAGIILLEDMLVLQDVLVSAGLAWVDNRFCKIDACKLWILHQADAQKAKRGLWSDSAAKAPWDWRREQRKKR